MFWNDIQILYIQAGEIINIAKNGNNQINSKKKSISYYLKKWHPVTLLNCDYKIASIAIANQLKLVLPNIIEQLAGI